MGDLMSLRGAARTAAAIGGVGSVALLVKAAQHPPLFLLVLFAFWVLAPFVLFAAARAFSTRWSQTTHAALDGTLVLVTMLSLFVYGYVAFGPPVRPAPFFVVVPPISCLVMAGAVSIAAWASGKAST